MQKIRNLLLIFLLTPLAILLVGFLFLTYLFKAYPSADYTFPLITQKQDYKIISVGESYVLEENGLPYPGDFEETTYPRQSLNGTWEFCPDPTEKGEKEQWFYPEKKGTCWIPVKIPSNYNTYNSQHKDYRGLTWFRHTFMPALDVDEDQFIRLCFQAVLLRSKVWLNGELLGQHEGGYTPFYFDITKHILKGKKNFLVVMSDNRLTFTSLPGKSWANHHAAWGEYGGIYRDVLLEVLPEHYVFKAPLTCSLQAGKAEISVEGFVHNHGEKGEFKLTARLTDKQGIYPLIPGNRVDSGKYSKFSFTASIPAPVTWSPTNPCLYNLELELETSGKTYITATPVGLRELHTDLSGLYLNGKKTFLRGICLHEDDPELGAHQTAKSIKRDLDLIQSMNANFIRLCHYPHNIATTREARNRGLMLSEEIPFYKTGMGWTEWFQEKQPLHKLPVKEFGLRQMHNKQIMSLCQRQLIAMVERNRNNPAVILWISGNESYTLFDEGGKFYAWMKDIIKAFDNTRLITMAELKYNIPLLDNKRNTPMHMDIASVNSYLGWYYGDYHDIGLHMDNFHELAPDKPVFISEFGAGAVLGRTDADGPYTAERIPPGRTFAEDYQLDLLRSFIETAHNKDYIIGVSPWVFADFWCAWFPGNPVPDYNCKGLFTREREPKKAYYMIRDLYREISEEYAYQEENSYIR